MRVLIFGFSVTAGKGNESYANLLKESLERRGREIHVDVVAIGGVDVGFAAFSIASYVETGRYDLVVLDVMARTGAAAGLSSAPQLFFEAYRSTLLKIISAGSVPLMVEFYRATVEPSTDLVLPGVAAINGNLKVASIDLATPIRELQPAERATLLKDTVHTTEAGARYYAALLEPIVMGLAKSATPRIQEAMLPSDTIFSELLPRVALNGRSSHFTRTGYATECLVVDADEVVYAQLPNRRRLIGISAVCGPRSGTLSVGTPEAPELRSVVAYDRFSYYERIGMFRFEPFEAESVVIRQRSELPTAKLVRGTPSLESRVGKVAHLVWATAESSF